LARTISVSIVGDAASFQKSLRQSSRAAKVFERDIGRTARGAAAASLSFHGLGRAAAYASGYLIGGAGLAYALKASIGNAESLEKATRSLSVVIQRNGGNVKKSLPNIERFAKAQADVGVSAVQAERGLARATAVTGSATAGMRAYTEALEISKATGKSFDAVLLAAAKANEGQTSALARYIGKIQKGTTVQQLYNDVQKKYAGQARANTSATDKLAATLSNTETIIGQELLPTVNKYATELANWLGKAKNQKRLQHDVNALVRDGSHLIQTLTGAVKHVTGAAGGFKKVLGLLLALKVASTLGGWAGAFKATGGQASAASGEVAILRGKLKTLATLAPILITVDILENLIPHKVTHGGQKILNQDGLGFLGSVPLVGPVAQAGAFTGRAAAKAAGLYQGGKAAAGNVPPQFATSMRLREAYLAGKQGNAYPFNLAAMDAGPLLAAYLAGRKKSPKPIPTGSALAHRDPAPKTAGAPLDRQSQIQDAVSQARLAVARGQTGSQAKLVAALKAEIDFDAKYAAIQQKLAARGGKDAKKHAQAMQQLLGDESSAYDEISAMTAKTAKKEAVAAKKKTEAAKKAAEAARKAAEAMRKAAVAEKRAFQQAVDSAKSVIGDLGQGPVATGAAAQFMQQYGGHLTAKAFTQDLAAQNKQGAGFLKNLNRLRKRGAPTALIQTLLGQGQGGMDEASALAGASNAQLKAFLRNYKQRQTLLTQVARMEVHTPKVTIAAKPCMSGLTRETGATTSSAAPASREAAKCSPSRRSSTCPPTPSTCSRRATSL
jgi:hypothetical protein